MKLPEELHGIPVIRMKDTPDGRLRVMLKPYPDSKDSFVSRGYEQEEGESTISYIRHLEKEAERFSSKRSKEVPSSKGSEYIEKTNVGEEEEEQVFEQFMKTVQICLFLILILLSLIAFLLAQN
jgi:hypothetical protein